MVLNVSEKKKRKKKNYLKNNFLNYLRTIKEKKKTKKVYACEIYGSYFLKFILKFYF